MERQWLKRLGFVAVLLQAHLCLLFSSALSHDDVGAEEAIVSDLVQWLSENGMSGVADGTSPTKVGSCCSVRELEYSVAKHLPVRSYVEFLGLPLICFRTMGSCELRTPSQ